MIVKKVFFLICLQELVCDRFRLLKGLNDFSSFFSGSGSSQGSHTSKYFGSIDSSENDHSRKQPAGGGGGGAGSSSAGGDGGEEQFIKCVLQDPIWLLMANTDEKVMMTYQLPVR